jgi:hypothetical protein
MKIYSVYDKEFRRYGQVVENYDTTELVEGLKRTRMPQEGTGYVPEDPILQELPAMVEVSERFYGGMPVQLGWCSGHNTKLNCLEYHRDSEFNLGTEDFILLLGRQDEIDEDGLFDTARVEAFRVPAGVMVEVFATSLHYAPCHTDPVKGFQVLVALPWGTNTEKPDFKPQSREDTLLTARNKWLLPHPDSDEAKNGAVIGLKGENIDIEKAI